MIASQIPLPYIHTHTHLPTSPNHIT